MFALDDATIVTADPARGSRSGVVTIPSAKSKDSVTINPFSEKRSCGTRAASLSPSTTQIMRLSDTERSGTKCALDIIRPSISTSIKVPGNKVVSSAKAKVTVA